jgi:hypothetical protein
MSAEHAFLDYAAPMWDGILVRILYKSLFRSDGRIVPVEVPGLIGASGDAESASDTSFLVNQNESIVSLVTRPDGTYLYARCVIALQARPGKEVFSSIWRFHFVDFYPLLITLVIRFSPGRRNMMFLYAAFSAASTSVTAR